MKNLHLIPTDKPSRLYKSKITQNISMGPIDISQHGDATYNLTIHITNDEEIKEGDYIGYPTLNNWVPVKYLGGDLIGSEKKIILTTDPDLIKDGVQDIDDEFLESFVKNPSCESVDVNYELGSCLNCEWNHDMCPNAEECLKNKYMIIISKEEPKQETTGKEFYESADKVITVERQETLEEAFKKWSGRTQIGYDKIDVLNFGAKWQAERMYSEEEVIDLLQEMNDWPTIFDSRIDIKEWFEQFKKK